ncbi:MAG: porin, partial [bacterium]
FFSGNLNHFINYRIEMELQGSDQKKLVDAYGESTVHKNLVLRFGQFKEPFSLEWQARNSAIYFVERSMGYHLTPKRDVGVMLHQRLLKNSMDCFLGLFNGDGIDGSSRGGQSDEPELAGRLIFRPFIIMPCSWLKSFQIGGSGTHAHIDLTNVNLEVQSTGMAGTNRNIYVFNANTKFGVLKGVRRRQRWALESAWVLRGMAVQGEYIHFRYTDLEPSGGVPQDGEFSSWYASTLFCLTGESFEMKDGRLNPIRPRKDFDPESGTYGAFVFALRIEHFTGDETWITKNAFVSVRESDSYSVAMNWILTPAFRLIMDYTFTNLSDPIRVRVNTKDGSIDYIEEEHVITARFYLSF